MASIQNLPADSSVTADSTTQNSSTNDPSSSGGGGCPRDLRDPNAEITPEQAEAAGLPEQKHAGAIGYGPEYASKNQPTIGEKLTGTREYLVGKLTQNPELEQRGHERKTGELKRKKAKLDTDPFVEPEDKLESEQSVHEDSTTKVRGDEGKISDIDTAAGRGAV